MWARSGPTQSSFRIQRSEVVAPSSTHADAPPRSDVRVMSRWNRPPKTCGLSHAAPSDAPTPRRHGCRARVSTVPSASSASGLSAASMSGVGDPHIQGRFGTVARASSTAATATAASSVAATTSVAIGVHPRPAPPAQVRRQPRRCRCARRDCSSSAASCSASICSGSTRSSPPRTDAACRWCCCRASCARCSTNCTAPPARDGAALRHRHASA